MDEIRDTIREAIELWLEIGEDLPIDQNMSEVLEMAV